MKKLIIILAIAILTSCTSDDPWGEGIDSQCNLKMEQVEKLEKEYYEIGRNFSYYTPDQLEIAIDRRVAIINQIAQLKKDCR